MSLCHSADKASCSPDSKVTPILSYLCSGPFWIHRLVYGQNLYIAITFFPYYISTYWPAVLLFHCGR